MQCFLAVDCIWCSEFHLLELSGRIFLGLTRCSGGSFDWKQHRKYSWYFNHRFLGSLTKELNSSSTDLYKKRNELQKTYKRSFSSRTWIYRGTVYEQLLDETGWDLLYDSSGRCSSFDVSVVRLCACDATSSTFDEKRIVAPDTSYHLLHK